MRATVLVAVVAMMAVEVHAAAKMPKGLKKVGMPAMAQMAFLNSLFTPAEQPVNGALPTPLPPPNHLTKPTDPAVRVSFGEGREPNSEAAVRVRRTGVLTS